MSFLEKLKTLIKITISKINMPIALLGMIKQPTHNYYNCVFYGQPPYAAIENHSAGSTSPRGGRSEQPEQYPVDTGDCTDTSNEKSASANQGT
jgi:hypothetical protein